MNSRLLSSFALLALLFNTACVQSKRNYIEVATFGDTASIAVLNDHLKEFEKKEGIKSKPIYIPYMNFSQKVISQLAAKSAPDVLWVEAGFYVTLQRAGALQSLTPFIEKDKVNLKEFY